MKKILSLLLVCSCCTAAAQNNLTANLIEGGRTLVTLIQVIKNSKAAAPAALTADSCAAKALADISYKNKSSKAVVVSLYKRTGTVYSTQAMSLTIAAGSRETLYELPAGIYKYRIEYPVGEAKVLLKEGEVKLQACDKLTEEIKQGS